MAQNPRVVGADTSIGIGPTNSAGDDPRRNSHDKVSDNQRTTRVSVAHSLAGGVQRADDIVVHELTVISGMTSTALLIGDGLGLQSLQVVRHRSLVLWNFNLSHQTVLNIKLHFLTARRPHPDTTAGELRTIALPIPIGCTLAL